MKTHELKIWPEFFDAVNDGRKTNELRKSDRSFQVGDLVKLREWDDRKFIFTGRECTRKITYITEGVGPGSIPPFHGLSRGYVILSLEKV